ncbi:MAG: hypothetical protein KDL09_05010 [Prosthecobacter sp.]|nr:hypothetical protein [Prosthecobacter sp.]
MGSPDASSGGGGLPNHSRLIPGSPALPNMMPGGNPGGMAGLNHPLPASSLLGREVSPAPISPVTQPLQTVGLPSLSLGGALGHDSPSPPVPAGRSLNSLRAPRGTNVIRLAFAAIFLIGFLGLVGFLLKDYLPGFFPSLVSQEASDEELTKVSPLLSAESAPLQSSPPSKPTEGNSSEGTNAPPLTETKIAPSPIAVGFDPTEPVALKAKPATQEKIAATNPISSQGASSSVIDTPVTSTSVPAQPADTLLEVPSKPAMNSVSSTLGNDLPDNLSQPHVIEEDDAPPAAKPAVNALKNFLAANSFTERLKYTLGAEHMKPLMERYYTRTADGPVIVDSIHFVRMDPNPELGSGKHCIFSLENKTWEFPVPVMLEEQPDGFKVDWLAFVEFKDRLLEKFFQSYQEGPARFHVGIIRHHYFEDGVPNLDRKDAFRVSPAPPNSFQASVFLDKESPLAEELRSRMPWETHVWAVVELEWKKLGSQQWVELSAVPQMHWYSLPMVPRAISTPQKAFENEELPPGISKNGVSGKPANRPAGNEPPPGIRKSDPNLPPTIKRPLPAGR